MANSRRLFFLFVLLIVVALLSLSFLQKQNVNVKVYQHIDSNFRDEELSSNFIRTLHNLQAQPNEERQSTKANKQVELKAFTFKQKEEFGTRQSATDGWHMDGNKSKTEKREFTNLFKSQLTVGLDTSSTSDSVPIANEQTENKTLAVLFSSWVSSQEKKTVHLNILRTWRLWKPHILPALFTDEPNLRKQALDHGWDVHPEPRKVCSGVPVFPEMFRHAMRTYKSALYGFVNGDILLANGILPSLQAVANLSYIHTKPVMVLVRRINVDFSNRPPLENVDNLPEIVKTGKIVDDGSSDGFFTNRHFPWDHVPDIVPGRAGYGMWMVAFARQMGVTIVDISFTTQAVHQTTQSGNFENMKHKDSGCNINLYKKLGISPNRWWCGKIFCADYWTVKSPLNASMEYAVQNKRKTNSVECGNCNMRLDGLKNIRFKRR